MPRLRARAGWLATVPAQGTRETSTGARSEEHRRGLSARDVPGGPRLARAVVLAVLCSYLAVQIIDVITAPLPSHGWSLAVDFASLAAVFALTIAATSASAVQWPLWRRLATLLAEGIVTYLPLLILGRYWADMAGFFAGSALLLLPGLAAWALFTAVVASMIAATVLSDLGTYGTAYLTLSTLVLGLVVFGLARLSLAIRYVHTTRGELAQMAVVNERMRFARDLHDLLGYSLSAITLKAELTRRLVDGNPARACEELAELLDIARQALADVRTVASGYRSISLAKEASSVTSLLAVAGINARVEISCGALDEKVDTVLATVVREAVTNVLRHSSARNCNIQAGITVDTIRLLVDNDGVQANASGSRGDGGLSNLRTRLEAIGGKLSAEVHGGWFNLLAEVPLQPVALMPSSGRAGALPCEKA